MDFEAHVFVGSARITEEAGSEYSIGNRHAFLLYMKAAKNDEYDLAKADQFIGEAGLDEIEISRSGKVDPLKINNLEKQENFDNAMEAGYTLIVYSDPIK